MSKLSKYYKAFKLFFVRAYLEILVLIVSITKKRLVVNSPYLWLNSLFRNGNRTEWSTIQGVTGRMIPNQPSAQREADWNFNHNYPCIVRHEVLLPINRVDK